MDSNDKTSNCFMPDCIQGFMPDLAKKYFDLWSGSFNANCTMYIFIAIAIMCIIMIFIFKFYINKSKTVTFQENNNKCYGGVCNR